MFNEWKITYISNVGLQHYFTTGYIIESESISKMSQLSKKMKRNSFDFFRSHNSYNFKKFLW